ncbi:MAG: hypothetical protein U0804_05200 [Gemmataceae bacterium]
MRHAFAAVAACCLVCAAGSHAADPYPFGFPKEDARGGVGAFRIWHADGKWHLRSSTENSTGKKEVLMVFSGTVRCDGKLTVEPAKLEAVGRVADTLKATADGKGFDFEFKTYGGTDEAVFQPAATARTLTFKLKIDGLPAPPFRVLVGEKSDHPDKSDFKLPAHPKK